MNLAKYRSKGIKLLSDMFKSGVAACVEEKGPFSISPKEEALSLHFK